MADSIFLTGASGFLGRRLVPRLAAGGKQRIVCLSRSKLAGQAPENTVLVAGDLLDTNSYSSALRDCHTVVHLAAATGKRAPAEYFRVNRDGTEALAAEAKRAGVQRFLHVSTIAVKFRDLAHYPYARSKQEAEAIVAQSGLRWTIIRPTIIAGRGSPALDGLARLASLPIVPVFGDGRTLVQPVFVDDLAACLEAVLEEGGLAGRTLEIGGPETVSIEGLLLRLRQARGFGAARVLHLPARPIATCLAWVEPFLRPLLPVTAGQLASFTNPGTIAPDAWVLRQQEHMRGLDEILR